VFCADVSIKHYVYYCVNTLFKLFSYIFTWCLNFDVKNPAEAGYEIKLLIYLQRTTRVRVAPHPPDIDPPVAIIAPDSSVDLFSISYPASLQTSPAFL
jgi:hypothetical protein